MFNEPWSSINNILEWIMNIVYLNILWLIFTLVGLVIFGWLPSTVALYATWRRLLRENDSKISIFKTFFQEYKQAFILKNIIGLILLIGGFLIYFYVLFYQQIEGALSIIYLIFITIVGLLFINLLIYLPPIIVHFNLTIFQYFKQALLISLSSPMVTIFFYIGVVLQVVLTYLFPAFIIVFGISALALFIMKGSLQRFEELGF